MFLQQYPLRSFFKPWINMLKNYLLISLRNIWKQKGYSLINILGLAIGLMSCLLIVMYILYETSFDKYNDKSDRIVRLAVDGALGGNEFKMATSCAPLGPALLNDYPEVETFTRIRAGFGFPVFRYKDAVFSEERWSAADSTFFDVFSVKFLLGEPETALNRPETIILTESTAKRYFGDENPIGKLLNMDFRKDWEVTAVIEDFPSNSHFNYDMLSSLVSYPQMLDSHNWVSNNFYTYVLLRDAADMETFKNRMPDLITRYVAPNVEEMLGVPFATLQSQGANYAFIVQELTDIHLHSHRDSEMQANGNLATIYIFLLIALFILVIACINYMNLATAKYTNRTKEVGIRKTLGSTRRQLIVQFLTESVVLTIVSVAVSILLIELILPGFNNMVGLQLRLNAPLIIATFLMAVFVGVFAGSYPSFFLSSYNPTAVLSANKRVNGRGNLLRNGLVIFQFTVSIILFICAMVVSQQLNYMQNKELGLNPDQVLVIKKTDDIGAHIDAFKAKLLENPSILFASNSTAIPGDINSMYSNVMRVASSGEENMQLVQNMFVDDQFADTYQIELSQGRFFNVKYSSDSLNVIMNQAAVEVFNFDDPLNERFELDMGPDIKLNLQIVGVMNDFHFQSLQEEIRPLVIYTFNKDVRFGKFVSIRFQPENFPETLSYIEKTWKGFAKDQAFEYVLFDEQFASQYKSEVLAKRLVTRFTVLAMLIACLGLFGLASFTAEKRTKEIGIRKVLGASVTSITIDLSFAFTRWVLYASLIAFPISWIAMNNWLNHFAYRIDLSLVTFILAGFAAVLIAMITVSFQTIKAATSNPIKSLRYE